MTKGVCRICGCTRIAACDVPDEERCGPGGSRACRWTDETETLCDAPACLEAAARPDGGTGLFLANVATIRAGGEIRDGRGRLLGPADLPQQTRAAHGWPG